MLRFAVEHCQTDVHRELCHEIFDQFSIWNSAENIVVVAAVCLLGVAHPESNSSEDSLGSQCSYWDSMNRPFRRISSKSEIFGGIFSSSFSSNLAYFLSLIAGPSPSYNLIYNPQNFFLGFSSSFISYGSHTFQ